MLRDLGHAHCGRRDVCECNKEVYVVSRVCDLRHVHSGR